MPRAAFTSSPVHSGAHPIACDVCFRLSSAQIFQPPSGPAVWDLAVLATATGLPAGVAAARDLSQPLGRSPPFAAV